MFTTIITDCKSENAKGRQETRFNSLGLGPVSFVGIGSNFGDTQTLEAGGHLIDILDASGGEKGVVSVNVAPRGDKSEGENGNSFCYFYRKETLVISTIAGHTLSFIKKLDVTEKVNILDTKRVLEWAEEKELISHKQKKYISSSQFRSFDFVPRIARWLIDGYKIPSEPHILPANYKLPAAIWYTDAFGNCKTTLTRNDIPQFRSKSNHPEFISGPQILKPSEPEVCTSRRQVRNSKHDNRRFGQATSIKSFIVKTNLGRFPFYSRLKDVPKGETALYVGSSGIGEKRFLEIATQAIPGSAAKTLKIKIGDKISLL